MSANQNGETFDLTTTTFVSAHVVKVTTVLTWLFIILAVLFPVFAVLAAGKGLVDYNLFWFGEPTLIFIAASHIAYLNHVRAVDKATAVETERVNSFLNEKGYETSSEPTRRFLVKGKAEIVHAGIPERVVYTYEGEGKDFQVRPEA